ncbi:MAG: hypothetical protein RL189_1141 [Pseudomonadota bacterium]|jgi:alpha-beta hydrolase superfamily lysophospholipase
MKVFPLKQSLRTICSRVAILSALATQAAACNSLFYQPDKFIYSLPRQVTPSFEEFRIPTGPNGEKLNVWKFQARRPRVGTVVHFHGNAQNMSAHVWFVAWMIDAGFDVVTFDYRGYGESDGVANRQNTIEDGQAVLNWVVQQPASAPVFVIGQSLGGAVAFASLAQLDPQPPIRALIIESSFVSYRQLARRKLGSFFLTWPLQWPLSFLVTDHLSPRELKLKSPLPIMFVHGTRDAVVPYSEGVDFAGKAEREQNGVSFFSHEGGGHTSCFMEGRDNSCQREVLQFLSSFTIGPDTLSESKK